MSTKTLTREQLVTLCVGNWLNKYSQIYPMYGKTLADLPERFEVFTEEFRRVDPEVLDLAFKATCSTCSEFPTPADVRKHVTAIATRVQMERNSRELASRPAKPELTSGELVPVKRLMEMPEFKSACRMPKQKPREIRQLTLEEHEARINELKRQAAMLQGNRETAAVR